MKLLSQIRLHCWLLAAVCFLPLLGLRTAAAAPELASEAAVLMDADTGRVLYGKNADTILYPASITKVLTGLTALQNGELSDVLTVSAETVKAVPRSSSHIALSEGEQLTLEDALYAAAISSANDAAEAIAEHIGGTRERFCEMMNETAAALGADYTHFHNASGLPDADHYTTALDMARIAAAALKTPSFLTIYGAASHTIPATNKNKVRNLVSKNKFVSGEEPCDGLLFSKTGWTSDALGTLVTAVRRGGVTLIAVTLKSPMLIDKYNDTNALFNYAFELYGLYDVDKTVMQTLLDASGTADGFTVSDFSRVSLFMPKNTTEADLTLRFLGDTVPQAECVTVPVSLCDRDGTVLCDTLVTLTRKPETQPAAQVLTEEPSDIPTLPAYLPYAVGGVVLLLLLLRTRALIAKKQKV